MKETYLGDGLYASFDGFQFRLRAYNPVRGDQIVYLEPAVLEAFTAYVKEQINALPSSSQG